MWGVTPEEMMEAGVHVEELFREGVCSRAEVEAAVLNLRELFDGGAAVGEGAAEGSAMSASIQRIIARLVRDAVVHDDQVMALGRICELFRMEMAQLKAILLAVASLAMSKPPRWRPVGGVTPVGGDACGRGDACGLTPVGGVTPVG